MEYLQKIRASFPSASVLDDLAKLYDDKLWHQLSLKLLEALKDESMAAAMASLEIYDNFISTFESKVNEVRLAQLVSLVGRRLPAEQSLELFQRVLNGRTKLGADGRTCLNMETALTYLKLGRIAEAKVLVEEQKSVVSDEAYVHSRLHLAQLELFRVSGQPTAFYRAALVFLSFAVLEDLDAAFRRQLGEDMAVAALTGEQIYNFGEVLATPILLALRQQGGDAAAAFLLPLVEAVSRGQVPAAQQLLQQHRSGAPRLAFLFDQAPAVLEKARLLAVVNLAFERPSHQRLVSFQDLAAATSLEASQVERLVMRAMSVGLVRGSIDQVAATVQISWIQPRVLDKQQLGEVRQQLADWVERTKSALVTIEDQTIDLFS
eukprot:gene32049-38753_t